MSTRPKITSSRIWIWDFDAQIRRNWAFLCNMFYSEQLSRLGWIFFSKKNLRRIFRFRRRMSTRPKITASRIWIWDFDAQIRRNWAFICNMFYSEQLSRLAWKFSSKKNLRRIFRFRHRMSTSPKIASSRISIWDLSPKCAEIRRQLVKIFPPRNYAL